MSYTKTTIFIIILVIFFKLVLPAIKRKLLFFPPKVYITSPDTIVASLGNPNTKFIDIVINNGTNELHGVYYSIFT
jgi:hypothetical protein